MEKVHLSKQIIEVIKNEVKQIRGSYGLVNKIIRDDVFQTLEKQSIVIYYPLDDKIDGFHITRNINGKASEFVYINTSNPLEKQIFCAAHELGHIWKIDEKVMRKINETSLTEDFKETIINRFAAELLMPEEIVKKEFNRLYKQYQQEKGITAKDLLRIIIYVMNYFFVPYKSVVYRFEEVLPLFNDRMVEIFIDMYNNKDVYEVIENIINEGNYTRLNNPTQSKLIENLGEYLLEAEKKGLFNKNKFESIRKRFNIRSSSCDENEFDQVINDLYGDGEIKKNE